MSNNIGRNSPCPCGSGKKYKKCCANKGGNITRVINWLSTSDFFVPLVNQMINDIFGKKELDSNQLAAVTETAIFEGEINKEAPIDIFVKEAYLNLEERNMYFAWAQKNRFSAFEILEVTLGDHLILKDLKSEAIIRVFENKATYGLQNGQVLMARILPFGLDWCLSGGLVAPFPAEALYAFKRHMSTTGSSDNLTEKDFLSAFYGAKKTNDPESIVNSLGKKYSYKEAYEKFKALTRKYEVGISIVDLQKRISTNEESLATLENSVLSEFPIKERLGVLDLLSTLWQKHPKFKKGKNYPGSMEKMLVSHMIIEASASNNPQEFAKQWLNIPQEELKGKTPKQVIVSERKKMGRKDLEPSYTVEKGPEVPFLEEGDKATDAYNNAVWLISKKGEFWKGLQEIAKALEIGGIGFLDEMYRVYCNVGVCLANLGRFDLAVAYFKKSLKLNPDYRIAKDNLLTFSDKTKLVPLLCLGVQELFEKSLFKGISQDFKNIEFIEGIKDTKSFLEYVNTTKIKLSFVHKFIPLKITQQINNKFILPTRIKVDFGKEEYTYKNESQFPKVFFLHKILEKTGFISSSKLTLAIANKGKLLLQENAFDFNFFNKVVYFWFGVVSWKHFRRLNLWGSNSLGDVVDDLQNSLWAIFKTLKDNYPNYLSTNEILSNSGFSFKKVPHIKYLYETQLELVLLVHLVWFGIVQQNGSGKYRLTEFGNEWFKEIEKNMSSLIPKVILDTIQQ